MPKLSKSNKVKSQGLSLPGCSYVYLPLPFVNRAAYSVGHVLNDLCAATWFSYLLKYLKTAVHLKQSDAGYVMFSGQIADAVATPLVGIFSDASPGCPQYGLGRRKLWNFLGVCAVIICYLMVFAWCIPCWVNGKELDDNSGSFGTIKTANYAVAAALFNFGWAAVQVSHMALIPELSIDEGERVLLNSARYAFTIFSNIFVFVTLFLLIHFMGADDSDAKPYNTLAYIVVGVGTSCSAFFLLGTKENSSEELQSAAKFAKALRKLHRVRARQQTPQLCDNVVEDTADSAALVSHDGASRAISTDSAAQCRTRKQSGGRLSTAEVTKWIADAVAATNDRRFSVDLHNPRYPAIRVSQCRSLSNESNSRRCVSDTTASTGLHRLRVGNAWETEDMDSQERQHSLHGDVEAGTLNRFSDRDTSQYPPLSPVVESPSVLSVVDKSTPQLHSTKGIKSINHIEELEKGRTDSTATDGSHPEWRAEHWSDWFKRLDFYKVGMNYMCTRLAVNVSQVYISFYVTSTVGMSDTSIALVPLVVYISSFFGTLLIKMLNHILTRRLAYLAGAICATGASILLFAITDSWKNATYAAAVLLGLGNAAIMVTSVSLEADLVGDSTASGAFVYGAMSFTDKLSNGIAVLVIQNLSQELTDCAEGKFYRYVTSIIPGVSAILGCLVCFIIDIPTTQASNSDHGIHIENLVEEEIKEVPGKQINNAMIVMDSDNSSTSLRAPLLRD